MPEQPGLHGQRKTPLPLVQVGQQRREPIAKLTDDPPLEPPYCANEPSLKKQQVESLRLHKLRNVLAKLPKRHTEQREQLKRAYWAALEEASDPNDAERRLRLLVGDLARRYPSAAACLADDLPALCVHLRSLPRLRKRFRSANLLERSLEEVRRRTKVIGRFPGETSGLSLCWAVLDLVIDAAHGLGLTDVDRQHLANLAIERQLARQRLAHIA